jgi:hypothetical protein
MLVGQGKGCLVVIEVRLLPGLRIVTGAAIRSQRVVVRIVFLVAANAGVGSLAERHSLRVTAGTGQGDMRIQQFEVGQVMGEARLAEPRDIGVTPVVLGVAAAAFTGSGRRHAAVIASLAADVFRNIFVTVETKRGLSLTIGTIVAVGAIAFDFGVRLGDGAGHHELLDAGSSGPVTGGQRD